MDFPLISVIIPVYNAEKYLKKCLESVLEQTFNDFEVLLIDDASPDSSSAICDEAEKSDKRVTAIHLEKNGGVSNARNIGIEKAQGEYILFIDSDDYIDNRLFENLAASLSSNPADVTVFGHTEEYYDKKGESYKNKVIIPEAKYLTTQKSVREEIPKLEESGIYGYPWNKLYKTSVIMDSEVLFEKMGFNEDIIFNINLFYSVKSLAVLDIAPYHYAKRYGSTTGKFIPTYYRDIMYKIRELYVQFDRFGILDHISLELLAKEYVRYTFSALERNLDRRSKLSFSEQKLFFEKHIDSNLYKNLRPYFPEEGLIGKMAAALNGGSFAKVFLIAAVIYFVKKFTPKLFSDLG